MTKLLPSQLKIVERVTRRFSQPDESGNLQNITRKSFKAYGSSSTLGQLETTDFLERSSDVYGGKAHTDIDMLEVKPKHRGKGLGRYLAYFAVKHSHENGGDGRFTSNADTRRDGDRHPAPFWRKIGLRPVDKSLDKSIQKDDQKTLLGLGGVNMYLPEEKINSWWNEAHKLNLVKETATPSTLPAAPARPATPLSTLSSVTYPYSIQHQGTPFQTATYARDYRQANGNRTAIQTFPDGRPILNGQGNYRTTLGSSKRSV